MTKRGPWTIKESEEKYKNKWITVTEHQVLRPDGKDGIFGEVRMLDGISILPIDEKGDAYLTQEFRFAVNKDSIECVSGGIDESEDPETAARRELKEELGMEVGELIPLGEVHPFTNVVGSASHIFLANNITLKGDTSWEGTEHITRITVPFTQVVDMVMKGEIFHSQTCTLILKANEYLKNQTCYNLRNLVRCRGRESHNLRSLSLISVSKPLGFDSSATGKLHPFPRPPSPFESLPRHL
jgi:ADP-ribose pyrophosphatase